jgi:prepilin-type N-terminal cleavage/methylation domain-containing protein
MSVVRRWAECRGRGQSQVQRGFTLLELIIVIILVILLFLVAFDRLLPLRGQAEATHVDSTVGTLRSALGMTTAQRILDHGISELSEMNGINPMALLAKAPDNYIGEIESANDEAVQRGQWYFERTTDRLGYRVRYPQYLKPPADETVHLTWRVTLRFTDKNGNGEYDPDIDAARGLDLLTLHDRAWQAVNMPEALVTDSSP